jgi:uncharacterized protein YuzE
MACEMKPCPKESTNVKAIGYDPEAATLRIQFASGKTYEYAGVPDDVYIDLMASDSIGRFVASNIRGKFETTPIEEKKPEEGAAA